MFGFSGVLLWKVREPRVNCGFIVGKKLATGFRVRPPGGGRKREVRWKWGEGVESGLPRCKAKSPTHVDEAVMGVAPDEDARHA